MHDRALAIGAIVAFGLGAGVDVWKQPAGHHRLMVTLEVARGGAEAERHVYVSAGVGYRFR